MKYDVKTKDNKDDYVYVRTSVFIEEQGFKDEFDEVDERAIHITLYMDDILVGCGRAFPNEMDDTIYTLGRIALLAQYRGLGYGNIIVRELERVALSHGATQVELHSQSKVQAFYKKNGYKSYGKEEEEEGVPHIWMRRLL